MDAIDVLIKGAQEEDRFVLMVGYSPNKMPLRGADGFIDLASPNVVEKACWKFMLNGAGGGLLHKAGGENDVKIVENYIYRNPVPWVLKANDGSEQVICQGDWVIGAILSPQTWEDFKKAKYRGGSIQGGARRKPASAETLARVRS
jgi:hypothetical protein